jgi:AmiR/NasT family two-component response regulator
MVTTNGDRFQVARAQGMVSVQVGCTLDEAVEIMQVCADETGQTLDQVATAVVNNEVRFDGHD